MASFSVLEGAFSVGDDYLLVHKSFSGRTIDQEETQPFAPSLVDPDVNVTKEDLDAQVNELQGIVSRKGIGSSSVGPQSPGSRWQRGRWTVCSAQRTCAGLSARQDLGSLSDGGPGDALAATP